LSFRYARKTRRELEGIANAYLRAHGQYRGCKVLIEEIVEAEGYDIMPVPGLNRYAEAYLPKREGMLFVDEDQQLTQPLRYRFTLAEELAHILIHRQIFRGKTADEIRQLYDEISDSDYADLERNAKYLAACLLMPKSTFIERFAFHKARAQSKTTDTREILSGVVVSVAREFDVSRESAAYRAKHLGLVSEEDLLALD